MDKKEYFNEFKDGNRDLFFIVTNDYQDDLKSNQIMFRKINDAQMSVVGFTTQEQADYFFNAVITEKNKWKIASINVMIFDEFLDSLDPDMRENLVFELM